MHAYTKALKSLGWGVNRLYQLTRLLDYPSKLIQGVNNALKNPHMTIDEVKKMVDWLINPSDYEACMHIFKERARKEKLKKAWLERQYRGMDKQKIEELLKIEEQRQQGMENQNWDYEEGKWSIGSIGKQKSIKDFQQEEEKVPEIKLEPLNKEKKNTKNQT